MKILVYSDLPSGFTLPPYIPDLVIVLGDIVVRQIQLIDKVYKCPIVGVLGNHDKSHSFDGTSIIDAHKKVIEVNSLKIGGFGGAPRYSQKEYGQYDEDEADKFVSSIIDEELDIFIAHSNPFYTHTDRDSHRGFDAFNKLIYSGRLNYFLHGHLHQPFRINVENTRVNSIHPFLFMEYEPSRLDNPKQEEISTVVKSTHI